MPGGRIDPAAIKAAVQNALVKKYGAGEWVAGNWDLAVYLNQGLIAQSETQSGRGGTGRRHERFRRCRISPGYTPCNRCAQGGLGDTVSQKVANGYHLRRGPDVELIPDAYWMVVTGDETAPRVAIQLRYARTSNLHGRGCSWRVNITSPSR